MRLTLAFVVAACDGGQLHDTCPEIVCRHVADCSPVITGGVDWSRPERCVLDLGTCSDEDACLAAVAALPCLSDDPTWDELDASTRAFIAVRSACMGAP